MTRVVVKNEKLTAISQSLRKNMTKEEKRLWYDFLRTLPVTVHRQKVIQKYVVDFYIADKGIVIELDGSQHYDPEGKAKDKERDEYLKNLGFTVLRYSNYDILKHFDKVCEEILLSLNIEL